LGSNSLNSLSTSLRLRLPDLARPAMMCSSSKHRSLMACACGYCLAWRGTDGAESDSESVKQSSLGYSHRERYVHTVRDRSAYSMEKASQQVCKNKR
jgi:hypothetical protein